MAAGASSLLSLHPPIPHPIPHPYPRTPGGRCVKSTIHIQIARRPNIEPPSLSAGAYGSAILCKDAAGDQLIKKNIKCRNYREVRDAKKEAQFLEDLKSTNVIG